MSKNNRWLKFFITEDIIITDQDIPSGIDESATGVSIPLPDDFKQKSLLVLVRPDANGALSEKNSIFLNKVLEAVNLSKNEIVQVYLPDQWTDLPMELYKNGPENIILFDPLVKPEGLTDSLYTLQILENVQWMLVDKLNDIESDVNKKRALWSSLKKLFKLS